MEKSSEILRQAKSLISTEETWCRYNLHQFKEGKWRYCSVGALSYVVSGEAVHYFESSNDEFCLIKKYLIEAIRLAGSHSTLGDFNDSHTHSEVMAVWDKAIELAEAEEMWEELKTAVEEPSLQQEEQDGRHSGVTTLQYECITNP